MMHRGRNNGRSSVFTDRIKVLTEQLPKKKKKKTDHFTLVGSNIAGDVEPVDLILLFQKRINNTKAVV